MGTTNIVIDVNYARKYIKLSFEAKQEINSKINNDKKLNLCFALNELYSITQPNLPKLNDNKMRRIIVYGERMDGNFIDYSNYLI